MTPSASQVLQAVQNHYQPARTPGGRIKDILEHIEATEKRKNPAGGGASDCRGRQSLRITSVPDQMGST